MKPVLITILVTAGALSGAAGPSGDADRRKADEAAVRALVRKWADAWAKGDGAYAALFTEDADYVTFAGARYTGRREIARAHRELFTKGSRLELQVKRIRILSP